MDAVVTLGRGELNGAWCAKSAYTAIFLDER
jgi:hypothetical protein